MKKYSVLEASKILNISKQAVIHRIKKNSLTGFKGKTGQWIVEMEESEDPRVSNEGSNEGQKVSNEDPRVSNEGSNEGQKVSNEDPRVSNEGSNRYQGREYHKPRREEDQVLNKIEKHLEPIHKNTEFLQLTSAQNQELVARLTNSLENQNSKESKTWIYSISLCSLVILVVSILFLYHNNQIKEEAYTLRKELKSEHKATIISYGNTIKYLDSKHKEDMKLLEDKYQIRYQKASNDYQVRSQELSNEHKEQESLLRDQIEMLKSQNQGLLEILKTSKSGNLN